MHRTITNLSSFFIYSTLINVDAVFVVIYFQISSSDMMQLSRPKGWLVPGNTSSTGIPESSTIFSQWRVSRFPSCYKLQDPFVAFSSHKSFLSHRTTITVFHIRSKLSCSASAPKNPCLVIMQCIFLRNAKKSEYYLKGRCFVWVLHDK